MKFFEIGKVKNISIFICSLLVLIDVQSLKVDIVHKFWLEWTLKFANFEHIQCTNFAILGTYFAILGKYQISAILDPPEILSESLRLISMVVIKL